MNAKKIAVIGAGPTGLAAALALSVLTNVEITIFDRAADWEQKLEDLADDPRVFELWPNAVAALEELGVHPKKTEGWDTLERYDFRSRFGELLTTLPVGSMGRRWGLKTFTVSPYRLLSVLAKAIEDQGKINSPKWTNGEDVTVAFPEDPPKKEGSEDDEDQDEGCGEAGGETDALKGGTAGYGERSRRRPKNGKLEVLVDGESEGSFDLVVGADGPNSALRAKHFPGLRWRESRQCAVVGMGQLSNSLVPTGVGFVAHGSDRRLGAWSPLPVPGTKEWVRWILFAPKALFERLPQKPDPAATRKKRADQEKAYQDALRSNAQEAVNGYGLLLQQLPRQGTNLRKFDLRDLELRYDQPWFKRQLVLVGDAAHPSFPDLGQGCALAFEDAVILRRKLAAWADGDGELSDALDAWFEARFDRVREVVEGSYLTHRWAHVDAGQPDLRDRLIATTAGPMMAEQLDHLTKPRV